MPLNCVQLCPGDLLYIPCGYWHRAEAPNGDEISISIAIGVMSRSAIELIDILRAELLQSLVWRQRLPVGGEANIEKRFQILLDSLADDAARTLREPQFLAILLQLYTQNNDR
jgi:ribosomal protein L16 Arg81 hydroxylase